jgi:hypothetical protein
MSTSMSRFATLLALSVALSACGATASGSARPADPAPTSTTAPTTLPGALAHPTGAREVILRFDEAGGFVPVEWMAAHVPYFTLYGDGRVVFVSTSSTVEPTPDGVVTGMPIRTAVLSEQQIQDLLVLALRDGGLAAARTDYQNPLVADAPTTEFEVHADGDSKTVSIAALGMEGEPGPDTAIKAAFLKLAGLLRDFDKGGTLGSAAYAPTAYRGVLNDASGAQGVRIRDWPWANLAPTDFTLPADPNVLQLRTRVLTPAEAGAIGVEGFENGIVGGVFLRGSDGRLYSLALRPLLPDERA